MLLYELIFNLYINLINIPYYTGCRRAYRKISILDDVAGVSYEKLSIEHHFTQNFLIRKITRPTDKMDTKFLWHNNFFFLHANMERVNGGFVVYGPFNNTLAIGDFERLCATAPRFD